MNTKFKKGMRTRKAVLGANYLNAVKKNITKFDKKFQQFITEYVSETGWSNENLTKSERSIITLAILASQGNLDEFKLHLNACKNTKTSPSDIMEVMMHVAVYAGIPRANSAIKLIKDELKEWK